MKIKQAAFLSLVLSAMIQLPAFAEEAVKLTAEYEQCQDRAESNTSRLLECEAAEFERQDRRLNLAYRSLNPLLSKKQRRELRAVHRTRLNPTSA